MRLAWMAMILLLCGCLEKQASEPAGFPTRYPSILSLRRRALQGLRRYEEALSRVDPKFAGVRGFAKDLQGWDASRDWDLDTLTVRNPDYWRAFMEVVPQDPSILFAHAYLAAIKGQLPRAKFHLLLGGLGMSEGHKSSFSNLNSWITEVEREVHADVQKGTALHDQKKYTEAIEIFDRILADFPEASWVLYEKSDAMLMRNDKGTRAAREKIYETIRGIDPFYLAAYQGSHADILRGQLPVLIRDVLPFIDGSARGADGLRRFAFGCEAMGRHALAAHAFWKLMATQRDEDEYMTHFLFNLYELGLTGFVTDIAPPARIKAVDALRGKRSPAEAPGKPSTPRAGRAP